MEKNLEQKYDNTSSIFPIYPSFDILKKDYNLCNKKVIDLGASDGRYLKYFGKGSCGVEYGEIDRKKAIKDGYNVIFGNFNKEFNFFSEEKFDFIFSSHVIEHLESPYVFLKQIRKNWGDNAKLILGFPTEFSLVRIFDPYFDHDGHIYSFSKRNFEVLLKETGFEIEKIYYDIPLAGRWKIFKWIQKIVQPLPYWMVSWRSNALYIVAKKTK